MNKTKNKITESIWEEVAQYLSFMLEGDPLKCFKCHYETVYCNEHTEHRAECEECGWSVSVEKYVQHLCKYAAS